MKREAFRVLIPLGIWISVLCYAAFRLSLAAGLAALLISAAALAAALSYLLRFERRLQDKMDDVLHTNTLAAVNVAEMVQLPCAIFDERGRIIWGNSAFYAFGERENIQRLIPGFNVKHPPKAQEVELARGTYQIMNLPVERSNEAHNLTYQYWIDRTEALHYRRLYEEQMPTVALIYIDNYEELAAEQMFARGEVLAEVEKRISAFVASIDGVYRQFDTSRYFIVFEQKRLTELEKGRFALLDGVREIRTGTTQPVTLSIAVGVATRVAPSDEAARQAMELALGRGGDQAVVKRGASYAFYGGKRQMATKQSKVKIRLFAKALKQLMENSTDVFIMGHRQPDLDCIGASLGLLRCARSTMRRAYIVLDEPNPSIEGALREMSTNPEYEDVIVSPEQAAGLMRATSMLILVDTQRVSSLLAPELIRYASKIVLIDHHRRSVDSVENATLAHLETSASSVCEIVTEILQYFEDAGKPTVFECCALLAGITVDTKHFVFSTGARTFEAASYLRRNGADTRMIKELFQDDMQTFRNRARVVQQAQILDEGVALAVCPKDMPSAPLIAAQAADALVSIRGIRASFVLAYGDARIMVSGRSLGEINVQVILERLGGGGHMTVAGAQLAGVSMEEAVEQVKTQIQTYFEEANAQ
ncbi:MAG: DHH family phosphoesterase [Bacillota bacterium]